MAAPLNSAQPIPRWDGKLPSLNSLLPHEALSLPRRPTSYPQHNIGPDLLLRTATLAATDSDRRHTIATPSNHSAVESSSHGVPEHAELHRIPDLEDQVMSGGSQSSSDEDDSTTRSEYCFCKPDPKIPRPRNAFILYRQNQHTRVCANNPGLANPEISRIIGHEWQHMREEDKKHWHTIAEEEKAQHAQKYPGYRYKPKRVNRHSTNSDNSESTKQIAPCQKCGGKSMNQPSTPFRPRLEHESAVTASALRGQKRPHENHVSLQHTRQPSTIQVQAHPGIPPRFIPAPRQGSVYYAQPPPQIHGAYGNGDGGQIKRARREPPYTSRQPHTEIQYAQQPQSRQDAMLQTINPARRSFVAPPPAKIPIRAATEQKSPQSILARRVLDVKLAPIKTSAAASAAISSVPRNSVDQYIIAYPVFSKLKSLQSIIPTIGTSIAGQPLSQTRGQVIAIEGLDQARVMDMATNITARLEDSGKFAVKVFEGPNLYDTKEHMTSLKYLQIIQEWHKISQEVTKYVMRPPKQEDGVIEHDITETAADAEPQTQEQETDDDFEFELREDTPSQSIIPSGSYNTADSENFFDRPATHRSPISAISPATPIPREILSVERKTTTKLRVPPDASISHEPTTCLDSTSLKAAEPGSNHIASQHAHQIPIAIISHYALTTIDQASILAPITDNYDALTHWRWHATLWRGCVGADVSIIVKPSHDSENPAAQTATEGVSALVAGARQFSTVPPSTDTQTLTQAVSGSAPRPSVGSAIGAQLSVQMQDRLAIHPPASSHPHPHPHSQAQIHTQPALPGPPPPPFGVEVRLQDYKAVIVRTNTLADAHARASNGRVTGELERKVIERREAEHWEAAKRRVGFEVEESLRR